MSISMQDMQTLRELFGNSWTSQQLEIVLRHSQGNLDQACDRILQHGDANPMSLIQQLQPNESRNYGQPNSGVAATTDTRPSQSSPDKIVWCWKETPSQMHRHSIEKIFGIAADCWIRYSAYEAQELESSYQLQEGGCEFAGQHSVRYRVDFATMRQINLATGYQRDVLRHDIASLPAPAGPRSSPVAVATPMFTNPSAQDDQNVPLVAAQVLPSPNATIPPTASTSAPTHHAMQQQAIPQQYVPAAPASQPGQPLFSFVAQQDFVGDASKGQLQFPAGTQVTVLPGPETNGWRIGRVVAPSPGGGPPRQQQGWFPIQFLPTHSAHVGNIPTPSTSTATESSKSTADIMKLYGTSQPTLNIPQPAPIKSQDTTILGASSTQTSQLPSPSPVATLPQTDPADPPPHPLHAPNLGPDELSLKQEPAKQAPQVTSTSSSQIPNMTIDKKKLSLEKVPDSNHADNDNQHKALSDLEKEIDGLYQEKDSLEPRVLSELVTRVCCKLDGVDVSGSSDLRHRRKNLIKKAESIDSCNELAMHTHEPEKLLHQDKKDASRATPTNLQRNIPTPDLPNRDSDTNQEVISEISNPSAKASTPSISTSEILGLYATSPRSAPDTVSTSVVPTAALPDSTKAPQIYASQDVDLLDLKTEATTTPTFSTFPVSSSAQTTDLLSFSAAETSEAMSDMSALDGFPKSSGTPESGFPPFATLGPGSEESQARESGHSASLYVAQYDFVGDANLKQLCFSKGSKIIVDKNSNSGGWSYGKYKDQKGWFPSSYVVKLTTEIEASQPSLLEEAQNVPALTPKAPMPTAPPPPIPPNGRNSQPRTGKRKPKPNRKKTKEKSGKPVGPASQETSVEGQKVMSEVPLVDDSITVPHDFSVMGGDAATTTLWSRTPSSNATSQKKKIPGGGKKKKKKAGTKVASKKVGAPKKDAGKNELPKETRTKKKPSVDRSKVEGQRKAKAKDKKVNSST